MAQYNIINDNEFIHNIIVSGVLDSMERDEFYDYVRAHGATVSKNGMCEWGARARGCVCVFVCVLCVCACVCVSHTHPQLV
jgi:hypothetical protein